MRIFIVEDEALLALLLTENLEELGHMVAAEANTLETALELASLGDFDAAILDTKLHERDVFPVAELLVQKGKPFFFSSGYRAEDLPEPWNAHCVMEKPFDLGRLTKCLDGLRAA
jgi:DNA-binding response OmpR family regulator